MLSPILRAEEDAGRGDRGARRATIRLPDAAEEGGRRGAQRFQYEGNDIITLQKLVERDYTIPEPQTAEEVISYYAKRIAQDVKLPSQFAALVPKVREFLETKAFGGTVDLERAGDDQGDLQQRRAVRDRQDVRGGAARTGGRGAGAGARSARGARCPTRRRSRSRARRSRPARRSSTWCRCDNEFERDFARFLDKAPDVERSPSCRSGSASRSSTRTPPATCATTSRISSVRLTDGAH